VSTVSAASGYSARKFIAWLLYVPLMAPVLENKSRGYCTCRYWLQCSETNRVFTIRAANDYNARKHIVCLLYVPLMALVLGNKSRGYCTYR
jgi:hypothetical protein